jgi:hypothetical protein
VGTDRNTDLASLAPLHFDFDFGIHFHKSLTS